MASGRLGSAYVDAKRTSQVYANSSGGAVSLSIMAQAKSTTANVPLSIKVDNGSTAAETTTQIDSNSYTEQALKLTYNSGITAVTAELKYSSYALTGAKDIELHPPSGTATGTDLTGHTMPLCTDPTFTNWKGLENNTLYPLYRNGSNPARWVSVAQAETAGSFDFISSQINQNYASFPTTTINGGLSYNSYGVVADPYCETLPIFGYQASNYMSVRHVTGASTSSGWNKTSNSIFQFLNGNGSGSSNQPQKHLFASGGMLGAANSYSNRVFLRYYSMNPTNDVIEQTISDNAGGTNSTPYYPLDFWFQLYGTYETGYPNIVFLEYDPHQDKIYTLMNMGETASAYKRVLYEWQTTKLKTLYANVSGGSPSQPYGTSTGGVYLGDDYERLVTDGVVIDRTSNLPEGPMTSTTCRMYAPMKRVQNKLWTFAVGDPYASSTDHVFYKTSDFLTYTQISSTEYYNELIDDDTTVLSNGTVTNKLVSNYSSLPDAGILEHQISVNNYERTGLVLSNNDKLYVRNHGDTGVAVSVMGYEE